MDTHEDEELKPGDKIAEREQRKMEASSSLRSREYEQAGQRASDDQIIAAMEDGFKTDSRDDQLKSSDASWKNNTSSPSDRPVPRRQKMMSFVRSKKGASIGIGGGLLGLIIGVGSFLSVSLLPLQFIETLMNHNDSDGRTSSVFYKKMLRYRLDGKADKICAKAPRGKACTAKTFGPEEQKRYKQNGFDLKGKEVNGRLLVTEIETPPDEKGKRYTVKTAKELESRMNKSSKIRSAVSVSSGDRYSSFGSRFRANVAKFGINFKRTKVSGDTKEERLKSFRDQAGIKEGKAQAADFKAKNAKAIKSRFSAGKGLSATSGACLTYGAARATLAGVKIYNGIEYAKFFVEIAKPASQIKESGIDSEAIDSQTAEFVGDLLTSAAITGANKGLTATDSQGYRAAAYGDRGTLQDFTSNMLLGASPALISLDKTINFFQGKIGKKNIRAACGIAEDPLLGAGLIAVACGSQAGVGAAAGSVIPGAGTAVGAIGASIRCLGQQAILLFIQSYVVGKAIETATNTAIDALTNSNLTSDLVGTEVGDASAIGANLLFNSKASATGGFAGTDEGVRQFAAATDSVKQEYIANQQYDAKSTPFDIYNQYSFLGSVVRNSGIIESGIKPTTILPFITQAFIPSAQADSTPYTSTEGFSPEYCRTQEQKDLKISCDRVGNTRAVMSTRALNLEVEEVYTYMQANNQADAVDGDGSTVPGSDFEKWTKYCAERGMAAIGETEESLTSDDYYWANGANCTYGDAPDSDNDNITDEQRDYFSAYQKFITQEEDLEDVLDENDTFSDVENTGAGTTFTIGTYNQKKSLSADAHRSAAAQIVDKKMDIVGTQETGSEKYSRYRTYLTSAENNYGVFPAKASNSRTCASYQAIFYNKDRFELVKSESETFDIPRYPDPAATCNDGDNTRATNSTPPKVWTRIPIAVLKDAENGQKIIVVNTHNVANVEGAAGTAPARSRYISAKIYVEQVKRLRKENPGIPIFLTGDFNEGTGVRESRNVTLDGDYKNLLYCMFAENGLMKAVGYPTKCPDGGSPVDFIYTSPEVKTEDLKIIPRGVARSDHDVPYVKVTVPGTGSATGGAVQGDDYANGGCQSLLSSFSCTNQCVAFIKFRLVKHGVIKEQSLGNGRYVVGNLGRLGLETGKTPRVNSVFSTSATSTPQYGHTGMVSKVNADGSIVVEEYNFLNPLAYGTRTVSKQEYTSKNYTFAYTGDKYK